MPEIPTYQSRVGTPQTSGLEPASSGIVGGGAIEQGFSNLSSALLVRAHYAQQQEQAEQVAVAGNIVGAVGQALFKKAQDLREVQAQDANNINPRDLDKDFQAFTDTLLGNVLNSEDAQRSPQLHKYLSTHLSTLAQGHRNSFQDEMNASWKGWNRYQSVQGIDKLVWAAAKNPGLEQQYFTLIEKQIAGLVAVGSYTGAEGDAARRNARLELFDRRATDIITMQPETFTEAVETKTVASFWNNHGLGNADFTTKQQAEHKALAYETTDRNVKEANRIAAEAKRLQVERHNTTDRTLMTKFLDHEADTKNPPLTFTEIADALDTDQLDGGVARAMENMLTENAKGAVERSDPTILHNLFSRIALPWGDPKKLTSTVDIYTAVARRKLSVSDTRLLVKDFDAARTVDGGKLLEQRKIFLDGQKPSIDHSNPLMGREDREGAMLFADFNYMALQEEAKAVRENRDPHALYDPQSPEYLGKRTGPFLKSFRESIKTIANNLKRIREQPPVPEARTRKPGESITQYEERTK